MAKDDCSNIWNYRLNFLKRNLRLTEAWQHALCIAVVPDHPPLSNLPVFNAGIRAGLGSSIMKPTVKQADEKLSLQVGCLCASMSIAYLYL